VPKKIDFWHMMCQSWAHHVPKGYANMSQQDSTRRGVLVHKQNPFMLTVRTKVKRVTNKRGDMMLVSAETGEIANPVAGFWEAQEVDSSKFVKLFVNGVKALAELSNAGTRVFEMQNNIGKDQVSLSYSLLDDAQQEAISRRTFSRGIAELIEKEFIAATAIAGQYWVNPDFIWNGDRLAFVKEFRRVSNNELLLSEAKRRHQREIRAIEEYKNRQPSLFDNLNAQDLDSSPFDAASSATPEDPS
jgi:hypothetical protein